MARSVEPPAGHGTISVTALPGKSCPIAAIGKTRAATDRANSLHKRKQNMLPRGELKPAKSMPQTVLRLSPALANL